VSTCNSCIKDKAGNTLLTEDKQTERWKEDFSDVSIREYPHVEANITTWQPRKLDIDTADITQDEIRIWVLHILFKKI
jgi:hypothetical protein